jgi:tetratricopeptide (TPR) repeat protein
MTKTKEGLCKINSMNTLLATSMILSLMFVKDIHAQAKASSYQTHSHLQFVLEPQSNTQVEKIEKNGKVIGFKIKLYNLTQVPQNLDEIQNFKDDRTKKIVVSQNRQATGIDLTYEIYLTDQAIEKGIEYFEYKVKTPFALQFDYWFSSSSNLSDNVSKSQNKQNNKVQINENKILKNNQTAEKSKKIIYKKTNNEKNTVSNFVSKCGERLIPEENVLIHFKVWHKNFDYKSVFKMERPDQYYSYPLVDSKTKKNISPLTREIAHYKLAYKLYKEKQFALALRTIDFFNKSYPNSNLKSEVQFIKVNILIELAKVLKTNNYDDQIYDLLRQVVLEAPESKRAENALTYLIQELMTKEDYSKALEYALLSTNLKNSENKNYWYFKLAEAEALAAMREINKSEEIYNEIIAQNNVVSDQAAFRVGEIYQAKKYFERAAIAYELAFKKFKNKAGQFPTAYFNLAESYFELGRYKEALKLHEEFIKKFPNEEYTWAGRFRVALLNHMLISKPNPNEAKQRQDVSMERSEHIENLYAEVVNRHPYSVGGQLALAYLGQCHRNTSDDNRSQFFVNFFKTKNLKLLEDPLLEPLEVEMAFTLAESRFHNQGGKYEEAMNSVDNYRDHLKNLKSGSLLLREFQKALEGRIKLLAKAQKAQDALNLIKQYEDIMPKSLDFSVSLALADSYYQIKNYNQAEKILNDIKDNLLKQTTDNQDYYHYLKAMILKMKNADLNLIEQELLQISGTGMFSALKYDELALVAYQKNGGKGDLTKARQYDELIIRGNLYKQLPAKRSIAVHIRYIETLTRLGEKELAVRVADETILKFGLETSLSAELFRVKELRAENLVLLGDDSKTVEALAELIQADPNYRRKEEFEFAMARSLRKLGKLSEAENLFRKIAGSAKDSIWKKSAKAELDQMEWENGITNQQ